MPAKLAEHLPNANETTRAQLFGSIQDVMTLPFGDPTRQGVIAGTSSPLPPPPAPFRSTSLSRDEY